MEINVDTIPKHNPPQHPYTKINECSYELKNLIGEIRNAREPPHISLGTSLDIIISSIIHGYGQLHDIYKYITMMRE